MSNRLARLEDLAREHALEELRRAWESLSDEEVAILLAPYAKWIEAGNEPGPKWEEVLKRAQAAMPEELMARARGLENDMEEEEISRRIHELVQTLGIFERGANIRRHMQERGAVWG